MAEKEYIERGEAKRVMKANDWLNPAIPNVVNMILDRLPTADVVEVVRCKDCRHRLDDGRCYKGIYAISAGYKMTNANDYCSYGERKEQQCQS